MAFREFEYRLHGFEGKKSLFPVIPLCLEHFGRTLDTDALVDTGSTYSIFKPEVAEALGLPVERGKKVPITTVGGFAVGYLHPVKMQVLNSFFECQVAFSRDLKFSLNLLGRHGFLDLHAVTFKQYARKIAVTDELA